MTAHTDGASRNESRSEGLELPPDTASASRARRYVRERLLATGHPELVECAVLGVDELVANACVHAGTPLVVSVDLRTRGRVRIEVTDLSPTPPIRREPQQDAVGGRGLTLLDACGRWGLSPTTDSGSGKTIWFEPYSSLSGPDDSP
jgi:anti-sigma regulatory factor (Ser/Thr protein kinase)